MLNLFQHLKNQQRYTLKRAQGDKNRGFISLASQK
jgi:hypothetical protein